jgi:hypothetical protein
MKRALMAVALGGVVLGCTPPKDAPPPKSTLVIGLDVSGSFRKSGHFDDAIDFAALYIYAHMKGFHDLKRPTEVFVGTMGGQKAGEAKTFHPIQALTGKSPAQIAASLRTWFPETDPITDFNAFFERVSVHITRQNLGLAPLNIVMFSDGVPDIPGVKGDEHMRRLLLLQQPQKHRRKAVYGVRVQSRGVGQRRHGVKSPEGDTVAVNQYPFVHYDTSPYPHYP